MPKAEVPETPALDDEVERLMDVVRESHFLTTEVSRTESFHFLRDLSERINALAAEIAVEIVTHERPG